MRLALTILASLIALPLGVAMADDDCFVPMVDWKPREAVATMAAGLGWTVRRIKIDDGCYEIIGTDAEGRRVEATVNPATLEILEIERHGNEGDRERKRHED
ncbi:PepSY domain-containing protein [Aquibium sp. LZ166]|uniref:PepSY domain-containing protein n=1 Tax=Aquibium pacificus TaxID=3153579 RepID=A0ABV3SQR7_9HYPH